MTTHCVICDSRPECLSSFGETHSILMLPVGTRYILSEIVESLRQIGVNDLSIVPGFEPDVAYEGRLVSAAADCSISIVDPMHRSEFLHDGEGSDTIIFVDPRYWPVYGFEFSRLLAAFNQQFVPSFAMHVDPHADERVERIVTDSSGNIQRIQRTFDKMRWSNADGTVVPCCIMSRESAQSNARFPLQNMRQQLATRAIPIRDIPEASPCLDLGVTCDLHRLGCSFASNLSQRDRQILVESRDHRGLYIAEGATIDRTAKFIGDVVINADTHVGRQATIIGPTVIGRGAMIGRGSIVANAVVYDRAVVEPGGAVYHEVLVNRQIPMGESDPGALQVLPDREDDGMFSVVQGDAHETSRVERRRTMTLFAKRAIDIAASACGLILLSPLLLLTALLVKLTSAGPLFFIHHREGKGGKEFGCIKFRTMMKNAHARQRAMAEENESDGPQFVIASDPRVTPIGKFLRKSNLDELPQLWNVLVGQMSLVGPRPSPFRENQICGPWRRARLSVRPGITGLWQICRHDRDQGDFHQWIHYDLAYVREISVWLDVKILCYTIISAGGKKSVPMEKVIPSTRSSVRPQNIEPVAAAV